MARKKGSKKSKGKRVIKRSVGRKVVVVKYRKGCKPKVSVRKK